MKHTLLAATAVVSTGVLLGAQALKVDASLPPYSRVSGISGSLNSVGSDSMNNMMTLWAETFRKFYPNVKIQVEGKGSSTAPPAISPRSSSVAAICTSPTRPTSARG